MSLFTAPKILNRIPVKENSKDCPWRLRCQISAVFDNCLASVLDSNIAITFTLHITRHLTNVTTLPRNTLNIAIL